MEWQAMRLVYNLFISPANYFEIAPASFQIRRNGAFGSVTRNYLCLGLFALDDRTEHTAFHAQSRAVGSG